MKLLLVGSGLSARQIESWNIKNHIVATINHAWRLYPDFDIAFYAGDLPIIDRPENNVPKFKNQLFVSDLVGPFRNMYTFNVCRDRLRLGDQSSLLMTIHWLLWYSDITSLNVERIGFIGCDLNYTPDENGHTHFYGVGKDIQIRGVPDPFLKLKPDDVVLQLESVGRVAQARNIELVNYSSDPNSLLPFNKVEFHD